MQRRSLALPIAALVAAVLWPGAIDGRVCPDERFPCWPLEPTRPTPDALYVHPPLDLERGRLPELVPSRGLCVARRFGVPDGIDHRIMQIHTELLMVGLACQEAYGDPALLQAYGLFTLRHGDTILAAQRAIVAVLKAERDVDGVAAERLFDSYRTALANVESQVQIALGRAEYCRRRAPAYRDLVAGTNEDVLARARSLAREGGASDALCD